MGTIWDPNLDGLVNTDIAPETIGAFVGGGGVVSHDRSFLDRTVTSVLEIDDHDHTAVRFDGGWQAYLAERATARRHAEEAFTEYDTRRRDLAARGPAQAAKFTWTETAQQTWRVYRNVSP